jgi:hypothetical protein
MQDIFNEHNFPKTSRTVNHLCNFVTTHVAPRGGRAFHEPLRPPCLLNLHGTVHHWLRSAQSMTDINLSMDQWWLSPDTSADEDVKAFVARCRQQLEMCNPVSKELLRSCELARTAPDRTVVLRFQYSDTGPDVSALYHTNSDRLPPHILLSKWPKDNARPKSMPLKHGEVDCLAFPLLFPFADSGYHPGLTLSNNRRMTRAQWLRYLVFNPPPHFVRQPRVFQEFILHVWNEIENERLKYFRNVTRAAGVGDDEDNVDEQEDLLESIQDENSRSCEVTDDTTCRPSFIPSTFTGGALRS